MKANLELTKVRDIGFCVRCNSCFIATVTFADGKVGRFFYCSRKDCDEHIRKDGNDEQDILRG